MGMSKISNVVVIIAVVVLGVYFVYLSNNEVPDKNYVGNSAEECSRIQVLCVEGFQRFDDKSGCGCESI